MTDLEKVLIPYQADPAQELEWTLHMEQASTTTGNNY